MIYANRYSRYSRHCLKNEEFSVEELNEMSHVLINDIVTHTTNENTMWNLLQCYNYDSVAELFLGMDSIPDDIIIAAAKRLLEIGWIINDHAITRKSYPQDFYHLLLGGKRMDNVTCWASLVGNPECPLELISKVSRKKHIPYNTMKAICNNPSTPTKVLERMVVKLPHALKWVINHPNISDEKKFQYRMEM